jgi:hypothetical protein
MPPTRLGLQKWALDPSSGLGNTLMGPLPPGPAGELHGLRPTSFLKPTQRVEKSAPTKPKAAGATGEREPTTVRRRGPKRSSPPYSVPGPRPPMAATPATASAPSRCLTGAQPRCAALRSPSSLAVAAPPAGLRPCGSRALSVRAKVSVRPCYSFRSFNRCGSKCR